MQSDKEVTPGELVRLVVRSLRIETPMSMPLALKKTTISSPHSLSILQIFTVLDPQRIRNRK
jgi:hypothetical protein